MKGISEWMWLIGGVIVGIVMFMLFFQLMSYLTLSKAREDAKRTFEDMVGTLNAMCESKAGTQSSKKFLFPDSVSIVYSTSDPRKIIEKNNRTYGKFVCLKFQKEQVCEGLKCEVEFHPIRNKENILGIVDTLLGRSSSQEYLVKLTKTECGISVLGVGENPLATCAPLCQITPLIRCKNSVILGLVNPQMLVLTDMARIRDCCTGDDNIIKLLGNAANYFGGKKILIIWELDSYEINEQRAPIDLSLKNLGFSVSTLRHKSELSYNELKEYDQLWLFRPGWCIPLIKECDQSTTWKDSEINAIGEFLSKGGKVFLFTDTSAGKIEDQTVVNEILKVANVTAIVDGSTVCGIGEEIITTTDIEKNPITNGLKSFDVTAATRIIC